jgi:hypothetical protein
VTERELERIDAVAHACDFMQPADIVALTGEVRRLRAEIAEWTNAARKVFKGPLQFTDAADFDRQQEEREKEGMAALNDLMLGNGWANVESESTLAHMAMEVESRGAEIERLREESEYLKRDLDWWKSLCEQSIKEGARAMEICQKWKWVTEGCQ